MSRRAAKVDREKFALREFDLNFSRKIMTTLMIEMYVKDLINHESQ